MTAGTAIAHHEAPAALNVQALLGPRALGHPVRRPRLVETHISWVLLTGPYAYKIRKPVRLPFLDFTTLEARRADCLQELELNRRWAPEIYLDVVPVQGSLAAPTLTGVPGGEPLDYAVKMRQFPDDARLDRVLDRGGLDAALLGMLVRVVARMHAAAPRAARDAPYGGPDSIGAEVRGNLDELSAWGGLLPATPYAAVRAASLADLERLREAFEARRRDGFVRECHGDLHLENLALVDGQVVPFDGVEFQPAFRWVDVASDLAFLLMDLDARGHGPAASALLNGYLQETGDYAALTVLRHYLRYRALVRAKVAAIRSRQPGADAAREESAGNRLVALAAALGTPAQTPWVLLTHGVSGTGKSRLARRIAMGRGAIWLRADVERARLFADGPGRYRREASDATYARLAALTRALVAGGWPVIVDATFVEGARRAAFQALARDAAAPFGILDLSAPRTVLEARVTARAARGDDPSQADAAVLAGQLTTREPLSEPERAHALTLDTATPFDLAAVLRWIDDLSPEPCP